MTEAKTRGLPVVFITDDTKPDWYRFDQDIPLGARYELREEIKREAGVSTFLMMTTEDFIGHAQKYLGDRFSDDTKEQAKELPAAARREDLVDSLLQGIATGPSRNLAQLTLAMWRLRTELGSAEMERKVIEAVVAGSGCGQAVDLLLEVRACDPLVLRCDLHSRTSHSHGSAGRKRA
jgi:hypothetical protein